MKNLTYVCLLAIFFAKNGIAQTQDEPVSFTYAEFRMGYGVSAFGENLKEKYEAGNFSTSGGFLASLAAYHKFKKINYLNIGIKYKSLGAFPSNGKNGDEMFFNYWGAAATVKCFPFDKNAKKGLYLQGDFFFITQFTQKYRNVPKLEFNHQFAIGQGVAFGLGYDIALNKKKTMLTIGAEYQTDRRRGEVQGVGIGVKYFKSSSIGVMAGIKF
jgi:predicted alpha-1,6-mannanase (GH76 family)